MGQVALGFRSLLVKGAIFFVMAALLAWALGGTLWPRPEVVDLEPVSFDGKSWHWRLSVGGDEAPPVRWSLMVRAGSARAAPSDERVWTEVTDLVVGGDVLAYAGRAASSPREGWRLEQRDRTGRVVSVVLPDRLAVEQALEDVRRGREMEEAPARAGVNGGGVDPGTPRSE